MRCKWYLYLAMLATLLAIGVIMLGAYVRLSQAGLGCPDWPGCYGHMSVPDTHQAVARADARYAGRPVEAARAWKEMWHRYFAGSLALLILLLAVAAWWRRWRDGWARTRAARPLEVSAGAEGGMPGAAVPVQPVLLPTLLLLTVIFQALLGMWTVTLLLFPPVVMGHLLGGFATFALLVLLVLQSGNFLRAGDSATSLMRGLAVACLVVLICQIALGGWVSSNYAGIACADFPTCQGQWWPHMNFTAAFSWHGLGPDYQGGVLSDPARVAIQVSHRIGALVTFLTLIMTSLVCLMKGPRPALKWLGAVIGGLAVCQVGIGVSIVHLGLPLALTDAHTGMAALLLASVVTLNWAAWARPVSLPSCRWQVGPAERAAREGRPGTPPHQAGMRSTAEPVTPDSTSST